MAHINYEKEVDKLYDALDVIAKFESGDQRELKQAIRNEIDRMDKILEELEKLQNGK